MLYPCNSSCFSCKMDFNKLSSSSLWRRFVHIKISVLKCVFLWFFLNKQLSDYTIQGVSKKCPKWKIASTSDIPQYLGYFLQPRVIRSLLAYLGQKIIFPSKFMVPGGCFLSSNFEMACAQKCRPENGIFSNWLQV